ncbi:MAG: hypothetical protein EOP73_23315 [Variovorax sp.]|nr:MAG: hypothetical protein EOP73_23315 [Variovorax sp.]
MKLLPVPLLLATALAPRERGMTTLQAQVSADAQPVEPDAGADAGALDWQSAWQRVRAQDEEAQQEQQDHEPPGDQPQVAAPLGPLVPFVPPAPARLPPEPPAEGAPVRALAPATPTTERMAALQQLAETHPATGPLARVWQVELPAAVAGPAWQLRVEQAQPLAPLGLELRVPSVAQLQARQQLSDLDKRLRDAGHDVLRPRLRDTSRSARRSRPVDEVDS